MQRAHTLHRVFTRTVKGLHLMIANDLHNGGVRPYTDAAGTFRTKSRPGRRELLHRGSHWLNIDGSLGLRILGGAREVILHRPAEPQVGIKAMQYRPMASLAGGMLYADDICLGACEVEVTCHDGGAVLFDCACALRTGLSAKATATWADEKAIRTIEPATPSPEVRAVRVTGDDGLTYLLATNFGDKPAKAELAGRAIRVGGGGGLTDLPGQNRFSVRLDPGGAVLCELVNARGRRKGP